MAMRAENGSVLMEFIIVLPLYFALLGTAFLYGDLSLHAVNMAASGDRTLAVSHGMSLSKSVSPDWGKDEAMPYVAGALSLASNNEEVVSKYTDNAEEMSENASRHDDKTHGIVADSGFRGSWTWLVGSTLYDDYALAPITRTFVRAWNVFADAAKMSDPEWETDRDYDADSGLKKLFPSSARESRTLGRLEKMVSKDLEGVDGKVRAYAYYTLMRNGKGRESYRSWTSSDEIGGFLSESGTAWDKYVYQEPYFFDEDGEGERRSYEDLKDDDSEGAAAAGKVIMPLYGRYGQFAEWSN